MSDLYWLTDEQMARLRPHFTKSHGRPRVDDQRVLSGIIFVNRNGLRWRDAPPVHGPHGRSNSALRPECPPVKVPTGEGLQARKRRRNLSKVARQIPLAGPSRSPTPPLNRILRTWRCWIPSALRAALCSSAPAAPWSDHRCRPCVRPNRCGRDNAQSSPQNAAALRPPHRCRCLRPTALGHRPQPFRPRPSPPTPAIAGTRAGCQKGTPAQC